MYKHLRNLTSLVIMATLAISPAFGIRKKQFSKLQELQHKAMHEIVVATHAADGTIDKAGLCTAYAVGPHTLLTAEHCDLGNDIYVDPINRAGIRDGSAHFFAITAKAYDHQDHMLLTIAGENFKDVEYLGPNVRLPKQGERVYFWGNPAGIRDQYREGLVIGAMPNVDANSPGDEEHVDAVGPLLYLAQIAVVGGDSGSSVFSETDGALIGIVTFGLDGGQVMGFYPIQFTGAQIAAALK